MGTPATFREMNTSLGAWTEPGGHQTVSCWRMTWRERLRVLLTGRVWLHVWGRQPPVFVSGERPELPPVAARRGLLP